jgi:DNA-binding response OmpR family regulator
MRTAKLYIEGGTESAYELRALLELEGYTVAATAEEADGILGADGSAYNGEKPYYAVNPPADYREILSFAEAVTESRWQSRWEKKVPAQHRETVLNAKRRTVRRGEQIATLTEREYALFAKLHAAKGKAVTREELHRDLWPAGTFVKEVDVYICYLREKLEPVLGPGHIRAVRGVGYRYEE